MCRRRVYVSSAELGFIPHGHLYGQVAFLVELSAGDSEQTPTYHELMDRIRRSKATHVHVVAARLGALAASDLAHYIAEHSDLNVTTAYHAGEMLPCDGLVYESVLMVSPDDLFCADELDRRAGSVCVQFWPGERTIQMLEDHCDSPYGLFMVLGPKDFGEAKVWLLQTLRRHWQLLPVHDFSRLEDAELSLMGADHGPT